MKPNMSSRRTSDYDAILHEYRAKLKEFTLHGACGRPYILVSKLTQWLKSKEVSGYNTTPANLLLTAAYQRRHEYDPIPISYEGMTRGENCCLMVFCILLLLDHGDLVARFRRESKVDKSLPIDLLTLRTVLDRHRHFVGMSEEDADKLAADFNREQWQFCPAMFEIEDDRNFGKDRVLPFCVREPINFKGGTASLWQVEVLEEFVGLRLREIVPNSRYKSKSDRLGYRYQFALKSFEEGHRDTYENEKNAFLRLRNHEGMVRFLTEYEHKELQGAHSPSLGIAIVTENVKIKPTYNILLEFGECDLEEYFAQRLPPVFRPEMGAFWKRLFEVADALEGIHNLKIDSTGVVEEFHGWHADIKPENILSVQGKFKLADPGFAKFVRKTDEVPTAPVMGGTESYGAPEKYSSSQTAVRQTIDIWSLGCVFSIAATWVVLDCQGIVQFSILRERAFKKAIEGNLAQNVQQKSTLKGAGDYFHDGKDVLAEVKSWHNMLRSAVRKTDTITGRVLDLVDEKMLLGSAEDRITAKELCTHLKKICNQIDTDACEVETQHSMPKSVMEFLLAVDKDAPSRFLETETPARGRLSARPRPPSGDRRTGKSRISIRLMKTSHRSETFESALGSQSEEDRPPKPHTPVQDDAALAKEMSLPSPGLGISFPNPSQSGHPLDEMPASQPYRPPHKRTLSETHFQTIFQAHEELNSQSWKVAGVQIKRPPKDEFLARHFDRRDIRFLIDNGETMKKFWEEAKYVLETLLMKARGLDEDGMDLTFTSGPCNVEGQDKERQFMRAMKSPDAVPMEGMHTDMAKALQEILDKYLRQARQPHPTVKKNLTLIVLTDGVWEGTLDKDKVRRVVVDFCESLEKIRGKNIRIERPLSIEFIQFGKDKEASVRLRHLDDDLKWDGVPDIIDTEHSSGNVYKMLLGSFVEGWDEEEDPEVASPTSSGQMRTSPPPPSLQRMSTLHYETSWSEQSTRHGPPTFGPLPPPRRAQTEQTTPNNAPLANAPSANAPSRGSSVRNHTHRRT